ncbi:MAG: hypothetical protein ACR2MM_03625, partial [Flavobacteriaceae bacterium]
IKNTKFGIYPKYLWNISIIRNISIYLDYIPNLLNMFQEEMANTLNELAQRGMENTFDTANIPLRRRNTKRHNNNASVAVNTDNQLKLF